MSAESCSSMAAASTAGQSDRWTESRRRAGEVAIDLVGKEGREGRQHLRGDHQRLVQGLVGADLVGVRFGLPEAAPRAADVPVGEVVDKAFDGARRAVGVELLELVGDAPNAEVELRQQPAIEER